MTHPPRSPASSSVRRMLDSVLDFHRAMLRSRTFELAAETAFWLFLSLIPLLAVAGLVAARVSQNNWERFAPVLNALPSSTRELIVSQLTTVARWNGGAVGLLSACAFVWAGSSGVHAILDALETHSGVKRGWIATRIVSIVACVLLSTGVALLGFIAPGFGDALALLGQYVPELRRFWSAPILGGLLGRTFCSAALLFAYTSALYWMAVPKKARKGARIVPGAIVAVLLEGALGTGYSFYVTKLGIAAAYGTGLAVIALTLMTLYLFVVALLTGAVVNRRLSDGSRASSGSRGGSGD